MEDIKVGQIWLGKITLEPVLITEVRSGIVGYKVEDGRILHVANTRFVKVFTKSNSNARKCSPDELEQIEKDLKSGKATIKKVE